MMGKGLRGGGNYRWRRRAKRNFAIHLGQFWFGRTLNNNEYRIWASGRPPLPVLRKLTP